MRGIILAALIAWPAFAEDTKPPEPEIALPVSTWSHLVIFLMALPWKDADPIIRELNAAVRKVDPKPEAKQP